MLFCLPPAGGGASLFRNWTGAVGEDITVRPVQLPGHEDRSNEVQIGDMSALVDLLLAETRTSADLDVVLFGHSMGATIGFEMARRLTGRKTPPRLLVVAGAPYPRASQSPNPLHVLPDRELIAALHRLDGIPAPVLDDSDFMAFLLPVIRTDLAVIERYTYGGGAELTCPVVAYGGVADSATASPELEGWHRVSSGAFRFRRFPGGHFFVRSAESQVLNALRADLHEAGLIGLKWE